MNISTKTLVVTFFSVLFGLVQAQTKAPPTPVALINQLIIPNTESVKIEQLASGLKSPWSLAFVGKDEILISEKHGGMRLWKNGALSKQSPYLYFICRR